MNLHIENFYGGIDFSKLKENMEMLKDKGLYGKVAPNDLKWILLSGSTLTVFMITKLNNPEILRGHWWYLTDEYTTEELEAVMENLYAMVEDVNKAYNNLTPEEKLILISKLGYPVGGHLQKDKNLEEICSKII